LSDVSQEQARFGIDELADFGGVSRRTVRYYVQEGLLPAPLGVGRGRHYDQSHVDRLLRVKALQEAGRSLDEIRALLQSPARPSTRLGTTPAGSLAFATAPESPASPALPGPIPRSAWRRLELAPGVELHVSHDIALPAPGRLAELAAWCARHLARTSKAED
jgi:DNA-binding transcriptional MerR regulator